MGDRKTTEVVKSIGQVVSNQPKSIKEVSEEAGVARNTASKWLRTLAEAGFLASEKAGRRTVYYKTDEVFLLEQN